MLMCYFAENSSNEANVGAAAAAVAAGTNDEPPAAADDKPGTGTGHQMMFLDADVDGQIILIQYCSTVV